MTPQQIIDEIQRLMGELAGAEYEHRKLAKFLALLLEGQEWIKKIRTFINT